MYAQSNLTFCANSFRPLIKILDKLLLSGALSNEDIEQLLIMIHPATWDETFSKGTTTIACATIYNSLQNDETVANLRVYIYIVGKDEHRKGILSMNIHEGVKLQLCYLLHHLCDVQLRHRIEYTVAFSQDYMGVLQTDQLRRYIEIKQSDMPSAVAAKKTKEFRCPPREQVKKLKHAGKDI